jgi:alpha-1,6-mannosyltransferase
VRIAALGVLAALLTAGTVATARELPAEHATHLLLYIAAGAAWALAVLLAPMLPRSRGDRAGILLLAIAMRIPAWLAPPVHSDDLHRYLWDGRVQRAGLNPYDHPPDAPELMPLRDENWSHVNNRQLPTIYPPLAQLLFRLAPSAAAWKAIVALADLGLIALLLLRLDDPRRAIAWAWCPLVVVELGLEAHVDGVGIFLLMAALLATSRAWAGALLGASASVKLLAVGVLPGLRSGRALAAFALAAALSLLPFVGAGARLAGSLGEYGRRWRGNDGAFALLYATAESAVAHTEYRGRVEIKGSRAIRFVTGRDRDTIFPDEVANFAARAAAALLWITIVAVAFFRGVSPLRFAEVALGAFLLLTPTLHPWYVLWVVPLVAAGGSPAWLALAALAPLGYEPLARFLAGGQWQDPVWTRALEHGLTWALLFAGGLIPAQRPLLSGDR